MGLESHVGGRVMTLHALRKGGGGGTAVWSQLKVTMFFCCLCAPGRVKTLHPGVHGGILAIRNNPTHMDAIKQHNIQTIDLVGVHTPHVPYGWRILLGSDTEGVHVQR